MFRLFEKMGAPYPWEMEVNPKLDYRLRDMDPILGSTFLYEIMEVMITSIVKIDIALDSPSRT